MWQKDNETMNDRYEVLQKEIELTRRLVKIHRDFELPFNMSEAKLQVTDNHNIQKDQIRFICESLYYAFEELASMQSIALYIIE